MKILNISYIGCGRIFKKHFDAYNKNKKYFNIEAVCDLKTEKIKKYNLSKKIKIFDSIDKLLQNTNSDLYIILTPSGYHYNHILKVGKIKKNILVEKPAVMNFNQSIKLKNFVKKKKLNLFVVKQNRFNPAIIKLKESIDKKRFGKIFLITIRVRWKRDDAYFKLDKWRGSWKLDGGVLANQASHHIDLMSWLLGDVESVYAKADKVNKITKAPDTVAAIIDFKNGATGILETTTAIQPENLEGSISVLGEKGSVEIGGFAVSKIIQWKFNHKIKSDKKINNYSFLNKNVYGFGHIKLYSEIQKALLKKKNNAVKYLDSMKTIKLIDKLYASSELNRKIKINDANYSKNLGK